MDTKTFLIGRGKALEESFFARHNEALRQQLCRKAEKQAAKEALREASGIDNTALLERLVELGVGAERFAALSLVPLVEVAWADGTMHDKERQAILKAAEATGITRGSLPFQLLERWLDEAPHDRLLKAWTECASAIAEDLSPEMIKALRQDLIGRANDVAEAAGGFLALGAASKAEKAMIEELEKAFG